MSCAYTLLLHAGFASMVHNYTASYGTIPAGHIPGAPGADLHQLAPIDVGNLSGHSSGKQTWP